ncbi:transcription factor IIIA [Apiospora kogelbergensis]|uniref:Transcription factor IIIA n=1 Tax=Apiospora kogelbergensis TaxID=1337665 RepID=A0AAW0QVA6_9PEZI
MKRLADAVDLDEEDYQPPPKRGRVTTPSTAGTDHHDGSMFDGESDYMDENGSIHAAPTPMTSFSGGSPPARKFPSDYKTIKCTWPGCTKSFNRPARLTAHMRSHNNERPFACPYEDCDKDYIEEKHLKQHIKGTHTKERDFTCTEPECGKSFTTSTRLKRHQAVHLGQEKFRCRDFPPCNMSFRKRETLERHIRSDHENKPAFACTELHPETGLPCVAAFDTSNALKRHTEREHGEPRFWCEECGNKDGGANIGFPTMDLLQRHMQTSHIGCSFCDRVFTSRENLDAHVDLDHTKRSKGGRKGQGSVPCPYPGCGKTFSKKSNLTTHYNSIHLGKRWICGETDFPKVEWDKSNACGQGFVTKGNLLEHVTHVHLRVPRPPTKKAVSKTGIKPNDMVGMLSGHSSTTRFTIPCTVIGCSFKFASQGDLQTHLHTEHGKSGIRTPSEADSGVFSLTGFSGSSTPALSISEEQSLAQQFPVGTAPQPTPSVPVATGQQLSPVHPVVMGPQYDASIPVAAEHHFSTDFPVAADSQFDHSPISNEHLPPHANGYWSHPPPHASNHFDAPVFAAQQPDEQWQHDEVEMRQLIGFTELDGFIDPALR